MTKSELIEAIVDKQDHLTSSDVELAVKMVLEKMANTLCKNQRIEIRGFGTFSKKFIRPRKFINPNTKKVSYIGETATMHFKPSKLLTKK